MEDNAQQWRPSSQDSANTMRKKYLLAPDIATDSKSTTVTFEPEWLRTNGGENPHHSLKTLMLRHMSSVDYPDDSRRLSSFQYEEYVEGLMEKIERQRKDIQTDRGTGSGDKVDGCRREEARHLKKRKPRSSLRQDNSFLDTLPKARMYRISALERKLWNEGKLKTIEDSEKFWNGITNPENDSLLIDADGTLVDAESQVPVPYTSKVSSLTYQQDLEEEDEDDEREAGTASLGLIREDTEPALRASSSGKVSTLRQRSSNTEERRKMSLAAGGRRKHPKVIEFEQKFKQVEFPKLSAFTLNLEPPKEDPEVSKLRNDFKQRANLRRRASKRLNKMYEMSLTHLAATQRMLDQNEELSSIFKDPSLSDVIYRFDKEKQLAIDVQDIEQPSRPSESHRSLTQDTRKDNSSRSELVDERANDTSQTQYEEESNYPEEIDRIGPFPLTLDAVIEKIMSW
ncbi:hypothetical protein BSL78_22593 [Apostichopus japonicus]|uniref:Uncharacterized protein n=1 Tax=Stichopus japonicus TaxID=307972 RepID=A0A2G8JXV9_STIJA|nr:hypothetical protein BSL78_22593 [Apostichopus japonicus]